VELLWFSLVISRRHPSYAVCICMGGPALREKVNPPRALKWPFGYKNVDQAIDILERYKNVWLIMATNIA
jgi:hypothetical protein